MLQCGALSLQLCSTGGHGGLLACEASGIRLPLLVQCSLFSGECAGSSVGSSTLLGLLGLARCLVDRLLLGELALLSLQCSD
jgi:hypothetical protein